MPVYKIYCDESRQTNSKYKLMGGIWIKKEVGWRFVDEYHNLCIKLLGTLPGHVKWTKIPPKPEGKYFSFYKILVDLYFKYNKQCDMFFKTVIADEKYDFGHAKYNDGDEEEGFYKLYYQLILNTLSPDNQYHIRVASKNVCQKKKPLNEEERLNQLQSCLNKGFCKRHGHTSFDNVVMSIEPRLAKNRRIIQLADIFMGAVGYHWHNFEFSKNAKESKVFLADYIANKLGKRNLRFSTSSADKSFNIFRFKPQK